MFSALLSSLRFLDAILLVVGDIFLKYYNYFLPFEYISWIDCIELEAPLSYESIKSESDQIDDPVNHVDLTSEINNKPLCITKTDTNDRKRTEYSYIPMQPRCNSTGQSSYSSNSTDNQYCRSDDDY